MAMKIGAGQIMKLRDHYAALSRKSEAIKKKGETTVESMVSSAEVSAAAFTFGALQGRYGAMEVLGVPADLGAAVLLHMGGFLGLAGKASNHLHAFGDGALASFFFTLGKGTGVNWKAKSLQGGAPTQKPAITP